MEAKKINFTCELTEVKLTELDSTSRDLVEEAKSAAERAYAPYSQFMVGAAVLLSNGKIYSANNQENVSFPVGTCAERLALGYAHGMNPDSKPLKLAIVARRAGKQAQFASVTPCGMCRQCISEYEVKFKQEIELLILTPDQSVLIAAGIKQFLPFKFEDLQL